MMNPQYPLKTRSMVQQCVDVIYEVLPRFSVLAIVFLCPVAGAIGLAQDALPAEKLVDRWVYLSANLQGEGEPEQTLSILRRAKAAGYNGILLADYKFHVLDRVVDRYFKNMKTVRTLADELCLEIIPAVAPFGYSNYSGNIRWKCYQ